MGTRGIGEGFPGDLVLDAGALIAFERGDERVRGLLKNVPALRARVFISATVLARAWRGGPGAAPVARLVDACRIDPLEEERAKEVGSRLGRRSGRDVADAHVVCCALESRTTIVTSDPGDVRSLVAPDERLGLIEV